MPLEKGHRAHCRWVDSDTTEHACTSCYSGFPGGSSGKESTCQSRRGGFDPWIRKIPWRRKWQPAPVFLPVKTHRQGSLVGYSPWSCKELDTIEQPNNKLLFSSQSYPTMKDKNSRTIFSATSLWFEGPQKTKGAKLNSHNGIWLETYCCSFWVLALYQFATAAGKKYHKLEGLNNRNSFSHSSGSKSKIKILVGLVPSEGCEGRICSRPPSQTCQWLSSSCVFTWHPLYV